MQFKLEELDYQNRAIASVVSLFDGQEKHTINDVSHFGIQANQCSLSEVVIHNNVKRIMKDNQLDFHQGHLTDDRDYCIEMETGTGKTITYIRTIYELHKQYGFSKFIIVVPSIAVRESVLNTLEGFSEQLERRYRFAINYFHYHRKKMSRLKHFITGFEPEIMITTLQSFASDDKILNQRMRDDSIAGLSFLEALGKTRPIIIMDEPQEGMDTPNSQQRLETMKPLCKIRYSATHKQIKNLLFRLTPYEAYRKGLVKKIEVLSVIERNDEASMKIELSRVKTNPLRVKLKAWRFQAGTYAWKETSWLNVGDNLATKTKNTSYAPYTIERIYRSDVDQRYHCAFTNGMDVIEKQKASDMKTIFRHQLHWLIRKHLEKKVILNRMGIKCLSLVFIDKVSNYVNDGVIKLLFEEEYKSIVQELTGKVLRHSEVENVQGYYFAKTAKQEYTDSTHAMKKNKEIYNLILKEKEQLLSLDNKVEFIFTHSALGVGWDNPNIFTIATLNQSYSEIKKRQEIGRGLRICVNEHGIRQYDHPNTKEGNEINLLTVIANESYETFVSHYQREINESYGSKTEGSKFHHTHKGKRNVAISETSQSSNDNTHQFLSRIQKHRQAITSIDEQTVITRAKEELHTICLPDHHTEVSITRLNDLASEPNQERLFAPDYGLTIDQMPIDLVQDISDQTELSVWAVVDILKTLDGVSIFKNPRLFVQEAIKRLRTILLDHTVRVVDIGASVVHMGNKGEHRNLTDHIKVISTYHVPKENTILTPIGYYQPNLALIVKREQQPGYLLLELKRNNVNATRLTAEEQQRLQHAMNEFEQLTLT
ncbi:DEAD/DEAH box helicase family protein [Desertibacillus haloalkaliphilus]|uniref:DEAD/DEAH box helicase family protein n=1 Tax=Desertibacillus haloalkaliphilus TaxID=1328930 RepID=UPI001C2766E5|nr:DEAD/DEAH box helicase family protein [Desertibacillus haloalkaliphilus]MBU8906014.1 DEAD/DEAH box helicase family protein [Desertibacillus haloalkaliphilus]